VKLWKLNKARKRGRDCQKPELGEASGARAVQSRARHAVCPGSGAEIGDIWTGYVPVLVRASGDRM